MDNGGQKNFKTSLCIHWLFRGACQRPNCHFAHGIDELQMQGRNIMESHEQQQLGCQQWRVKPCKWQQQGYCRYGNRCTFLHSDEFASDVGGSSISISYRGPRASGSNENGNGQQQAVEGLTDAEMQLLKKLLKKINVKD